MLVVMETAEVLAVVEDQDKLEAKVEEAMALLDKHKSSNSSKENANELSKRDLEDKLRIKDIEISTLKERLGKMKKYSWKL